MNRLRSSPLSAVRLRDALGSALDALPDGELLDRFARSADHAAFEVVVRRHGPMVLGVCRRTLANAADADDAFQATFLVLVRKAHALHGGRLGPWLYGVAGRVAMKARAREARRAAFRTEVTDAIPDPAGPPDVPDWLPILDAELNALPPKYRDALVLCELQGATRADAAKRLGVPEGTLSSRLARGRDLLRGRLLTRGTLLPAGGLAALFAASGVGRAVVPAGLLVRTAGLSKIGTGAARAGAVPAGAARLTDEVLKGMFFTKLRLAGGALALAALVAIGLSAAALPTAAPAAAPVGTGVPPGGPAKGRPEGPARPRPVEGPDRTVVQGYWKLEKMELPAATNESKFAEALAPHAKHMWLLVEGDAWWWGTGHSAVRYEVTLTPERNPKWIDAPDMNGERAVQIGLRDIYRLPDADTLELCLNVGGKKARPAEFVTDDEHGIVLLRFKRHTPPEVPAAGRAVRRPLHGSWHPRGGRGEGPPSAVFTPHFAFLSDPRNLWTAYTYEVDAEKDPAWIDMTPVPTEGPLPPGLGEKPLPIYGVYAFRGPNDSGLDLALGRGVKRVVRPLEFTTDETDKATKVQVLNLARAAEKPSAPAPKE